MPVAGGPKITTTGILLEVDAANASSYTSGSSTWVNVFNPGTRNGTINGTVGFSPTDNYGALTYPGTTSSYVDFGNIGDLSVSWSFQVAVKPAPSASGNYTILSYASGSDTGSITYKLDYSSSNQSAVLSVFSSGSGAARAVHTITGSVPTGSWSIINASYGSSLVSMYINGRPVRFLETTGSTVGYNTNSRLYLGGTFRTTSSFYTGSMASFLSYNTDVTNAQLVQNYNAYATRFGLPPSVLFPATTDIDAFRFIEAAGLVDPTQITAVNNLVAGLKSNNLWNKMQTLYPFVGGTAASHKFNLLNPINSNSAFRLLFYGDVTHSNLGVSASSAGYADTLFVPTTNFVDISSSIHTAIYVSSRPVVANTSFINYMGDERPKDYLVPNLSIGYGNGSMKLDAYAGSGGDYVSLGTKISGSLFISTRTTSANMSGYGISSTGTVSGSGGGTFIKSSPNTNTVRLFGAYQNNFSGGVLYQYASIGTGLTQTDAGNLYTLLTAFNNTLGRS
jgi:hypothetical protein